ncbi:TetR/AcrR family transcriptional regulator [Micromonospora purpureochromogenes]|uniref:TetR/AcrR family transcriptional regulator n=1 Tax=Micromonospora purpureochromogenes TaxID=47872 RepID=UPI0033F50026
MPKLWNDTIEAHRAAVRDATLDATAALVAEHGLTGVTMSRIAEVTGIGRATLYKYFPDVQAILLAWHERQISRHLTHLVGVADSAADPVTRLHTVLHTYARMSRHRHSGDLAAMLHRGPHVDSAHQQLSTFIAELLTAAAHAGAVRDDIPTDELAAYCLHALAAASTLDSDDAVNRLITLTLAGLRP